MTVNGCGFLGKGMILVQATQAEGLPKGADT